MMQGISASVYPFCRRKARTSRVASCEVPSAQRRLPGENTTCGSNAGQATKLATASAVVRRFRGGVDAEARPETLWLALGGEPQTRAARAGAAVRAARMGAPPHMGTPLLGVQEVLDS
mmetsp:Transcript_82785/g.157949  ORF Transcript_82785/g.157949 Transcript_82785/m.157949 type:complete len:118 (+) Transcript_82785:593-946(+)